MKKKILPIIAASLMGLGAFALGACNDKAELTKVDEKPATCTEAGNIEYYTDGTKYFADADGTVEITLEDIVRNALGHTAAEEYSASATEHWHNCTVCGDPADGKTAHTPSVSYITGDGMHWRDCTVCSETVGEKQAHVFEWVTDSPATETENGLKHEECVCGEKRSENTVIPAIPAESPIKHDRVEPGCGTPGNIEYWTKGGKYYSDESCENEITEEDTVIDPTGAHTQKSGFEKDETQHWHICGECETVIGEKQNHSFAWVIDSPATETAAGVKHEECECGATRNENTEIPMLGVTVPHDRVEPSCGTPGNIAYWEKNGKYYRDEQCTDEIDIENTVIPATGEHSSDNVWHTSDGKHWKECSECHTHLDEADHDDVSNAAWTDNGDEHVKTCSTCSLILDREDHSYSDSVTAPTCTDGGYTTHTCECGNSYTDAQTDALGHLPHESFYVAGESGERGKFYSACPRCGEDGKAEVGVFDDRSVTINGTIFSSPYDCYTDENINKGVTYDAIKQLFVIHLDGEHFTDTLEIVTNNNNVGISVERDTALTSFTVTRADYTSGVELKIYGSNKLTVSGGFPTVATKITVACDLDVNSVDSGEGINSITDFALKFVIESGTTTITQTGSGNCGFSLHRADDEVTVCSGATLNVTGFAIAVAAWNDGIYKDGVGATFNVYGTANLTSTSGDNDSTIRSVIVNVGSETERGNLRMSTDTWAIISSQLNCINGNAVIERRGDSNYAVFNGAGSKLAIKRGFELKIMHMSTTAYGGTPKAEIDVGVNIKIVDMRDSGSAWLKEYFETVNE